MPAFSGLFAPHWRSEARGIIVGLTSYITKGHLARAVLEATALADPGGGRRDDRRLGVSSTTLKVDGGMTADHLLMQTIADVLDVPVLRPMVAETVSLGAAYAAGLAVGYWPDLEGLRRNWHLAARWTPHGTPRTGKPSTATGSGPSSSPSAGPSHGGRTDLRPRHWRRPSELDDRPRVSG